MANLSDLTNDECIILANMCAVSFLRDHFMQSTDMAAKEADDYLYESVQQYMDDMSDDDIRTFLKNQRDSIAKSRRRASTKK